MDSSLPQALLDGKYHSRPVKIGPFPLTSFCWKDTRAVLLCPYDDSVSLYELVGDEWALAKREATAAEGITWIARPY